MGEARRHVALLCEELGFNGVLTGQAGIVTNELGGNLHKHARRGQLWIATSTNEVPELEILAVDVGPGIRDIDMAMRDGFSTGGSPGTGLGAVKRLSADFDIHSEESKGTIVLSRLRPAARREVSFQIGVVAFAAPGEMVCGDSWAVACDGQRAAMLLADGLGHGVHAAEASQAAVGLFVKQPFASMKDSLELTHAALRMTRGAAAMRAVFDADADTVLSAGAGNVMMRLVSGVFNRSVLAQNGTVGVQMRRVEETLVDWPAYALVVCFSDGLHSHWPPEAVTSLLGRDPSLAAAVLVRDYCRGRDDVTVVVLRRKN